MLIEKLIFHYLNYVVIKNYAVRKINDNLARKNSNTFLIYGVLRYCVTRSVLGRRPSSGSGGYDRRSLRNQPEMN